MLEPSNGQLASDALIPLGKAASQLGVTVRRLRYAIRSGQVRGLGPLADTRSSRLK
jgi:hypothetical protein